MPGALRILLVEDDEDLVACLRAVLEDHAFAVNAERDGAAALCRCAYERPDVVLVDLHLPGEPTGAALVRALRDVVPPPCRLILLSAEIDLALRAHELAADGYLEKPFDIETLLHLLGDAAHASPHAEQHA